MTMQSGVLIMHEPSLRRDWHLHENTEAICFGDVVCATCITLKDSKVLLPEEGGNSC